MIKIIVRMRGGLGNQLFILAFAYNLVRESNAEDYEIVLDLREYEHYKIRSFELGKIIKDDRIRIYNEQKDKSIKYEISRRIFHIYQKVFKKRKYRESAFRYLSKHGLYYSDSSIADYSKPEDNTTVYEYGYFQEAHMAENVTDILKSHLDISKYDDSLLSLNRPCIAVSVRCGDDYVNGNWTICDSAYYRNAIEKIKIAKKYQEDVPVVVFSDSFERAKRIIHGESVVYAENQNPIQQIRQMTLCSDFVISNSSFSWWGALLGSDSDSIIVAPRIWHDMGGSIYQAKLVTSNMIVEKNKQNEE